MRMNLHTMTHMTLLSYLLGMVNIGSHVLHITTLPHLSMVRFVDRVNTEILDTVFHCGPLEKNTPVYMLIIGMDCDPEYFTDPQKYEPEWFTEESKQKRRNFVYFPFGEGAHVSIGKSTSKVWFQQWDHFSTFIVSPVFQLQWKSP